MQHLAAPHQSRPEPLSPESLHVTSKRENTIIRQISEMRYHRCTELRQTKGLDYHVATSTLDIETVSKRCQHGTVNVMSTTYMCAAYTSEYDLHV